MKTVQVNAEFSSWPFYVSLNVDFPDLTVYQYWALVAAIETQAANAPQVDRTPRK